MHFHFWKQFKAWRITANNITISIIYYVITVIFMTRADRQVTMKFSELHHIHTLLTSHTQKKEHINKYLFLILSFCPSIWELCVPVFQGFSFAARSVKEPFVMPPPQVSTDIKAKLWIFTAGNSWFQWSER